MEEYIVDKLSSISEKLGGIDTKIEYVITDIKQFKEYIRNLEYDIKKVVLEIQTLHEYNQSQDSKIELLQYQVSDIEDRLYKLSWYIDKFSSRDKVKLKLYLKFRKVVNSKAFKYISTTFLTAIFLTITIILLEFLLQKLGIDTHYVSSFKEFLK